MPDAIVDLPLIREVKTRTSIDIEARATINLAESEVFETFLGVKVRGRDSTVRSRVIGVYLEWYWSELGETPAWHLSNSASRIILQRRTLDGWGQPVRRGLIGGPEIDALIKQFAPSQRPEVTWHD